MHEEYHPEYEEISETEMDLLDMLCEGLDDESYEVDFDELFNDFDWDEDIPF